MRCLISVLDFQKGTSPHITASWRGGHGKVGMRCNGSSHVSRKELSLVLCTALQQRARSVRSWSKAWCFELWPLIETKWDILYPSVFLPEDLRCMYPSQVWRLVCYPGSPPVPWYSGTIPGTVCSRWLCEHRGKKNWVAGAIQFPLAGRPLQGHNWSEGTVFRGAKSLLCHSSSREIQIAGADTRSPEKHVALTWLRRGAEGKRSVTQQHLLLCGAEDGSVQIQRWQIQAVCAASQSKHWLLRVRGSTTS